MKLKSINFYRMESRFRGEPETPKDMLRYDAAFVCETVPGVVAFPVFHTKTGNLGGIVTNGRWNSCGLRLTRLPEEEQHNLKFALSAESWVTYRHPRTKRDGAAGWEKGAIDYSRLEAVTLARYLQVKDTNELD